jgi:hypothetical protein
LSERAYTVRPWRPGDEAGILALFNSVFGEGDPNFQPRTPEQWRWLYRDNPAGSQIVVASIARNRRPAHRSFGARPEMLMARLSFPQGRAVPSRPENSAGYKVYGE